MDHNWGPVDWALGQIGEGRHHTTTTSHIHTIQWGKTVIQEMRALTLGDPHCYHYIRGDYIVFQFFIVLFQRALTRTLMYIK